MGSNPAARTLNHVIRMRPPSLPAEGVFASGHVSACIGPTLAQWGLGNVACIDTRIRPLPLMARRLSWSDVRGGLLACCALVVAVVATLKYSRVGSLHGDTFALYAHVGEARGVLVGSEVWLNGQKIGRISAIRFRSPSIADTASRIEIRMEVLEKYRSAMHRDAQAQIRAGGTVIGQPVVYITPGTVASTIIRHDDTVATKSQADVENAAGAFGMATRELPAIVGNVKEIVSQLQTSRGTVGSLLNAPGGPGGAEMTRARAQAERLGKSVV